MPTGNAYLKGTLGIVAMTAARNKTSFLSARYRRVRARRGHSRALVALERTVLELCWHLLTTDSPITTAAPTTTTNDDQAPLSRPPCNDSATPAATSPPTKNIITTA